MHYQYLVHNVDKIKSHITVDNAQNIDNNDCGLNSLVYFTVALFRVAYIFSQNKLTTILIYMVSSIFVHIVLI